MIITHPVPILVKYSSNFTGQVNRDTPLDRGEFCKSNLLHSRSNLTDGVPFLSQTPCTSPFSSPSTFLSFPNPCLPRRNAMKTGLGTQLRLRFISLIQVTKRGFDSNSVPKQGLGNEVVLVLGNENKGNYIPYPPGGLTGQIKKQLPDLSGKRRIK